MNSHHYILQMFRYHFDSNPDPDIFGNSFLKIGIICPNRILSIIPAIDTLDFNSRFVVELK